MDVYLVGAPRRPEAFVLKESSAYALFGLQGSHQILVSD